MRTRIALATAVAAASTTIITSNIAAADLAATGHRKSPAGHARTARSGPPGGRVARGRHATLASLGAAGTVGFTPTAGTVGFTPTAGTGSSSRTGRGAGTSRSIAAEVSMSNALQLIGAGGFSTGVPTAVASAPPPPPPPPPTDATSTATPDWQCIRVHESGDVYNDPARPSGAYGILLSTWRSFGLGGWPYQASPTSQDALALTLYHRYGWAPWSTRYACGLG